MCDFNAVVVKEQSNQTVVNLCKGVIEDHWNDIGTIRFCQTYLKEGWTGHKGRNLLKKFRDLLLKISLIFTSFATKGKLV